MLRCNLQYIINHCPLHRYMYLLQVCEINNNVGAQWLLLLS